MGNQTQTKRSQLDMRKLIQQYHEGTDAQRNLILQEVIIANEPFIKHVLNRSFPTYARSYEDMMQEARIAIMVAFPRFDPEKGTFTTFMHAYIMEACKKHLCEMHNISPHYFAQHSRYVAAKKALAKRGMDITTSALANEMNCGVDATLAIANIARFLNTASIEGDSKDKTLEDNGYNIDPIVVCEERERIEALQTALNELTKVEQEVIKLKYLHGDEDMSLRAVGARLNLDTSAVRNICNRALRKLAENSKLSSIIGITSESELRGAADDIVIEFTMSKSAIEGNLAIAMDIELDIEL